MANRLVNATSPYLLQHANNPVDWYEWGDEALARAKREDKPIVLSIGYAACHWCHVMERESFEDAATAALMNENFVCIKVDREERPDLDSIYMDAVQAMTGHGGWPMTMFCSPDGVPLYGGTYFPPEDRHGLPAFRRVLGAVAAAWREKRGDLLTQGSKLLEHISVVRRGAPASPSPATVRAAFDALVPAFDRQSGGFGHAPKFPQPMNLEFVLRCVRRGFAGAEAMLATTLSAMARGGIYDQIGGGFHRYSVDAVWLVPHFEKMLYDNGALLRIYARAAVALPGDAARYRQVATGTGEYLLREMRHPSGGLYSSQDADSEGVEGRFYVWSQEEFTAVAGDAAEAAAHFYGVTPLGNWEGANILTSSSAGPVPPEIEPARARLYGARAARPHPATDDKVVAGWNGIAISGLAEAGRLLGRDDFVDAAVRAAEFLRSNLRRDDGRLMRSWRDGRTSGPAYLDDYALVASALLDLYETTFDERHFHEAQTMADAMIALFADERGGFHDTGFDADALVLRPKDLVDNAVPAGNSVAAELLLRLTALTGEASYEERAAGALALVHDVFTRAPTGFGHALCAFDAWANGVTEVALAGDPASEELRSLARVAWERVGTPKAIAAGSGDGVPLLRGRNAGSAGPLAYVCERFACRQPANGPVELAAQLDA